MYQKMTANLVGARKRYETLNGQRYLVVPTVMLTEGVHAGSQGPLLYLSEEYGKNPLSWNHKPIILNHPEEGINTGCDPAVLEAQGVGMMLNTGSDGRLKTESWLLEDKLAKLSPETVQALNRNETVEVSTGLHHDLETVPGKWNGKDYSGIVRNIQPDHLAILPNAVGACSVYDGAGLLRNAAHELSHNDIKDHLHKEHNGNQDEYESTKPYSERIHINDVYPKHVVYDKGGKNFKHGFKVKDGRAKFDGDPEEVHRQTTYVTANGMYNVTNDQMQGPVTALKGQPQLGQPKISEMSGVMRKNQFQRTLSEKYGGIEQGGEWGGWVEDIQPNSVTWSKDGKHFQLPYTYDDDKINFQGDPVEVEKVSEYRRKNNTPLEGNQSPYSINKNPSQERVMALDTQKLTTNSVKLLTEVFKLTPEAAQRVTQNAMHQGAGEMISQAISQMGDGQARTTEGGARAASINKMIAGGKWKEEDRQFLSDLPDDHFQRVEKNALAGATQAIVPYSYEGIGDRSNVHTANSAIPAIPATPAKVTPMTDDQYIASLPPRLRGIVLNSLAQEEQERTQLIQTITQNQQAGFNPAFLQSLQTDMLRGMARLAQPTQNAQQQAPIPHYAGQASIPMFVEPQVRQITANEQQNAIHSMTLPLPSLTFESEAS